MPSKVYNNVEGHRLLCDGKVVEDITSVTMPTIKHGTTTIDVSGMAMAVDMPNATHLEAMEFSVSHNNGVNHEFLSAPGKHVLELRIVRQRFNVALGEIEHESVKYRVTGIFKETGDGDIKTDNPIGATEKYSVLRFEKIVDGVTETVIDAMAGIIRHNGVDYADSIESMLA